MPDRQLTPAFDPARDIALDGADGPGASLVWFIDFACPHTRRIRDVMLRSVKRFAEHDAVLAVRLFPGENDEAAEISARAAIAAAAQDRYADMHRALFSAPPDYTADSVRELAQGLKLDMARFDADLQSEETTRRLEGDRQSAIDSGVLDTPIFFIDGRRYRGAWDETSITEAIQKPLGLRLRLASVDFFQWAASAGLVLVLATLAALVLANVGLHDAYESLRETEIALSFGRHDFSLMLEEWINDGLMALFFLLVGIEIKREIVDGELSDRGRAALPIIGALGGMAAPALIYAAFNWGQDTIVGWGVPMATDIAFTLGIMALLGSRVPTSLKVFVSALAIADDLGAILVIAVFYGEGLQVDALISAGAVFAAMIFLNRSRVYAQTPYLLLGILLWFFIHESGLHATLAGVLTAAVIPSRPSANIRGVAAQTAALLEAELEDESTPVAATTMTNLQESIDRLRDPGFHLQHSLENWSSFLILPLFAFFNTGLLIFGSEFDPLTAESLGVMLGLIVGKPLGIFLFVFLAVKLGLARLSSEVSWMHILGAGSLAGVGFTMSIFIATAAFGGAELEAVKLATLLASTVSAVIGVAILLRASAQRAPAAAPAPA